MEEVAKESVKKMSGTLTEKCHQRETVNSSSGLSPSVEATDGHDIKTIQLAAGKQSRRQAKQRVESCSGFNRVMPEGVKQLSKEEMALLEIDIFKPLDFYEILFNRMKASENGRIITNINEL